MSFLEGIGTNSVNSLLGTSEKSKLSKTETNINESIFDGFKKEEIKGKVFDLSRKDIKTLEKMGPKGQELLAMIMDFDPDINSEKGFVLQIFAIRNKAIELLVADNTEYDKKTAKLLGKLAVPDGEYRELLLANQSKNSINDQAEIEEIRTTADEDIDLDPVYEETENYVDVQIGEDNELEYSTPESIQLSENYSGKTLDIVHYNNGKIVYNMQNEKYSSDFTQVKDQNGDVSFEQNSLVFMSDSTGAPLIEKGPVWELGSTYQAGFMQQGEYFEVNLTREAIKTPDGKIEMVLMDEEGGLYPIDDSGLPMYKFGQTAEELYGTGTTMVTDYQTGKEGAKFFDGSTVLFDGKIYEGSIIVEQDGSVIPTFVDSNGQENFISEATDQIFFEDYNLSHTGSAGNLSPRWEVGDKTEEGYEKALTEDYIPVYKKDGKQYLVNPDTGELARDSLTGEPILLR